MSLTYIGLKPRDVDKVTEVCEGIYSADVTFQYSFVRSMKKNYSHLLMVKSDSVDQAHKRGVWLINNIDIEGLLYWVVK